MMDGSTLTALKESIKSPVAIIEPLWCDVCEERGYLQVADTMVCFDGERILLCEECLERGRAP